MDLITTKEQPIPKDTLLQKSYEILKGSISNNPRDLGPAMQEEVVLFVDFFQPHYTKIYPLYPIYLQDWVNLLNHVQSL